MSAARQLNLRYQSQLANSASSSSSVMRTGQKTLKTSSWSMNRKSFVLLLVAWCSGWTIFASAQYHGYSGGHESGGGGGYDGMDERPKLNLGIRLRIPAFKFTLPRFSLPKITVSAKIRQPDKPRVITLPEINLDTTSKVEQSGSKMGGNGYGGHNSYGGGDYTGSSSSYGHPQEEKSQMFTFSTAEETHPSYGNNYGSNNRNQGGYRSNSGSMQQNGFMQRGPYGMNQHQHREQQQEEQQQYQNRPNSPRSRPSYNMHNQPPRQSQNVYGAASSINNADLAPDKNADIGFNSPVNADLGSNNGPTISSER